MREKAALPSFTFHVSRFTFHKLMTGIPNKTIVLVLNRNWRAINIRTPADAFCQMATNVATALEIGSLEAEPVGGSENHFAVAAATSRPRRIGPGKFLVRF